MCVSARAHSSSPNDKTLSDLALQTLLLHINQYWSNGEDEMWQNGEEEKVMPLVYEVSCEMNFLMSFFPMQKCYQFHSPPDKDLYSK